MVSANSPSLPVINFNILDLKPGTPEWELVKSKVQKAIQEYGCFEALFNKVPLELQNVTFAAVEELFDLPSETKMRNVSEKPFHGYIEYPPQFESIGFDEANILEKVDSLTNVLWPEGNTNFSKAIVAFSNRVSELEKIIRMMFVESLGVEKYLDEHMNSTYYLLRVNKYGGPQSIEKKPGLKAHTDKNVLTILYQNKDGLEVQTKNGDWIDVKTSRDSFIVLIGESLNAWANGRLYSAPHRVMMTGNEARYSLGLFSMFKAGYMVKAPEELVDEEHPLLFKPFDYSEFLKFYKTIENRTSEYPLKAFCGL